ncbi:hypothetical protein KIW84_043963 [Lathyrus oleraceus]|uniref:Uncharacterized protein n=1 Tax=Pisum sativum TaxID=3888 RepID=A0A9D5AUS6_PEA|nr:hypothetical protein KIW84_043963 [Pisum sativum]
MASTPIMPSQSNTRKNSLAFTILLNEDEDAIDYIPEPLSSDEKTSIWAKHVLIPYSLHNKLHAFLDTYPTKMSHAGKVSRFFPSYSVTFPFVFKKHTLDLSFMVKPARVFLSAPHAPNKEYIAWLDKVQSQRKALLLQDEGRAIKGTRLAWITPQENPLTKILFKYINLFLDSSVFDRSMAPFVDRLIGLSWLRNRFPSVSPFAATMLNSVWEVFLTPTLLSTRIEIITPGYGFVGYQPNLVAR